MSSSALGWRAGAAPGAPAGAPASSGPGPPASRSSTTRSASVKMARWGMRISAPPRREVDVLGGDLTGAGHHQGGLNLRGIRVHPADDPLEVQDDVGDVLLDAADRRELMGYALDAHAGHGRAGQRGEQHAPERVAEGVSEAAVEGLDGERASMILHGVA